VTCASIGFFVGEDQPVVWRGPMLHKALEQFLTDFYWGEPDYVLSTCRRARATSHLLAGFLRRPRLRVTTRSRPPSGWRSGPG